MVECKTEKTDNLEEVVEAAAAVVEVEETSVGHMELYMSRVHTSCPDLVPVALIMYHQASLEMWQYSLEHKLILIE